MDSDDTNGTRSAGSHAPSKTFLMFLTYHVVIGHLLTAIILAGNTIILVAIATHRPLRRKETILIGSLAVSDLLVGIAGFVSPILSSLSLVSHGWNPLTMLKAVVINVSMIHTVFIGLNRFIAIVLPLRYSTLVTKKSILIMVMLVWTIPVVLMVPLQVYVVGRGVLSSGIKIDDFCLAVNSIVWFLFLILALVILYSKIIWETRAQARKVRSWQQQSSSDTNNGSNTAGQNATGKNINQKKVDRSKKSTKLVMVILSVATLLNLPYFVYSILLVIGVPFNRPRVVLVIFAQECYRANAGINIFIYAIFTGDFRQAYKKLFCCCRNKSDVNQLSRRNNTDFTDDGQVIG